MKTLVFCTSYATSEKAWEDRHAIWIKALQRSHLEFAQLLIVDDGSQVLPNWPGITIVRETDCARPESLVSDAPILLYTHEKRLGRQSVFEFPGWYRSFAFGILYGAAHGFDKIIHIESDAFLITDRIVDHFNDFARGWCSVWCEAYLFPEIAIQAIAKDEIANAVAFVSKPYSQLEGQIHEFVFPFTHVELFYAGNRYGEMIGHVPPHADYSTQTHGGQPDAFYWWIPSAAPTSRRLGTREKRVSVAQVRAPYGFDIIEGSWSAPEDGYNWMLDLDSTLFMPSVEEDGDYDLELELLPCTYQDRKAQRLYVLVNETLVDTVSMRRHSTIVCRIPPKILRTDMLNKLRFLHPDAFAPQEIGPHPEARKLSFALARCEFFFRLPSPQN